MPDERRPGGESWRASEGQRLLDFGERSVLTSGGFGWLDSYGNVVTDEPLHLWINTRMTHVFSLAAQTGQSRYAALAEHGVTALGRLFEDREHGGWFQSVHGDGRPDASAKTAYEHAFVLLAGSSATAAGIPGGPELMERARSVVLEHFWDPAATRFVEQYAADWSDLEPYRGANSNMHAVEALLTTAEVTDDDAWRQRALGIADQLINGATRRNDWRIPEHFDSDWHPLLEYNQDHKTDRFRPYGSTIGHWLEWSRLLVSIEASLLDPPDWLLDAATRLFENAARVGWRGDGTVGAIYTSDWQDQPVVDARLHWVMAEAVLAADALHRRTGHAQAGALYWQWWQDIDEHFVDLKDGSWLHELDGQGHPTSTVWNGKPDVYHAYQATLLPDLPLGAAVLRRD